MENKSTKLFKALSDTNRVRILKLLQWKSLCACEITAVLELANSTVSKHLSILKEAGFIREEKDGRWVNYSLNTATKNERVIEILVRLDFWIEEDALIKQDREKVKAVNRVNICSA